MTKPKELLDAVTTARSIHDGDYSSLRGKSFLVCGNIENNQGRKKPVKKSNEERITLAKLAKQMNDRFDNLEKDVNSLKRDVKDINTRLDNVEKRLDYNALQIEQINKRLDYNALQIEQINKRLDYNGLQIEQINKRLDYNNLKQLPKR